MVAQVYSCINSLLDLIRMEFELNIPTGQMVFANDLRNYFPVHGEHNLNTLEGIKNTTQRYAKIGLAFPFVGTHKYISLYKENFKTYYIGTKTKNKNPVKKTRTISQIYCDLWWYSIADASLYSENGGKFNDAYTIPCEAGVYKFTQFNLQNSFEGIDFDGLMGKIEKVRDPEKTKIINPYFDLNLTAGQVIQYYIQNKQDVLGNCHHDENHLISHIVGMIFSQNEYYHPNGWMGNVLDYDLIGMGEIAFNGPVFPYALDKNSLIFKIIFNDMRLNDSFRKLAISYFKAVLEHGYTTSSEEKYLEFTKELAEEALKKLY